MTVSPTLAVVAEVYYFRDNPPPWERPEAEHGTFAHVVLSDETTLAQVGAIVATVVHNSQFDEGRATTQWLDPLLAHAPFSVKGGVVAGDGMRSVWPGCCCSVSGWREWKRFAAGGESPWMGHDPTGWAEWVSDVARVWSEGGYTKAHEGDPVEFPRDRFVSELVQLECNLLGFLDRVEEWADCIGYHSPAAVRRAFAESVLHEPAECGSPSPPV